MPRSSSKGSEVPLWVIIYHENFAERDWVAARFVVYTQVISTEASQQAKVRKSAEEAGTRTEILPGERKVCDTLHFLSKVWFMDMAPVHLGRDTEHRPKRAKVQNNKSQVSLVSPRAELKEYTALVFQDQALQLE